MGLTNMNAVSIWPLLLFLLTPVAVIALAVMALVWLI